MFFDLFFNESEYNLSNVFNNVNWHPVSKPYDPEVGVDSLMEVEFDDPTYAEGKKQLSALPHSIMNYSINKYIEKKGLSILLILYYLF